MLGNPNESSRYGNLSKSEKLRMNQTLSKVWKRIFDAPDASRNIT